MQCFKLIISRIFNCSSKCPILVTPSEDPKVEFDTDNQILEDFSQDPEHVSLISEYNLFYEETDKLKGKPKLVGGNFENYRPRT